MKFKVSSMDLINTANVIIKGLGNKDPQAQTIFSIIKKDEKNMLLMKCRSQSAFFKGEIEVRDIEDPEQVMEWGVDGNQLKTILSILPKVQQDITFNMSESNRQFNIESGENKFKLPVFERPTLIKEEEIQNVAVVDANEFMFNVGNLSKLSSTDVTTMEHPISCLHIFFEESGMTLMATNSIALAEVKQETSDHENNLTVLVKSAQVSLLMQSGYAPNDTLQIVSTDTMIGYIDKYNILSLVSKANIVPIDYSAILKLASDKDSFTTITEEFNYSVESLAKLCPTNNYLTFNIAERRVDIENDNKDKMRITVTGEHNEDTIVFLKSSLSLLSGLMTEYIKISWDSSQDKKLVKMSLLDDEQKVIENTFIGIMTK